MNKKKKSAFYYDLLMNQLYAIDSMIDLAEFDREFNTAMIERMMSWCWDTYRWSYEKMTKQDKYDTTVQITYVDCLVKEFNQKANILNPTNDAYSRAKQIQNLMEENRVNLGFKHDVLEFIEVEGKVVWNRNFKL